MSDAYYILHNKPAVLQEGLWELVHKWEEAARVDPTGSYLCKTPELAYRQALGTVADELSDVLLDFGDEDGEAK